MPPKIHSLPSTWPAGRSATARRVQRLQDLPPARLVLGIDPGLHRTGYGLLDLDGKVPRLAEAGVLRARADDDLPERLHTLHTGLKEIFSEHAPEVMVIEDLFSTYAHPRSALLMAHARGVLMLAAAETGVRVHSFMPNEVKQVVSGNGHASKAAMQAAVKSRLRLAAAPDPPDVADALAIALCFALRQNVGTQTKNRS